MPPAALTALWLGWELPFPSEGVAMCSIVSEAPSAMTSLLLSSSRSRCGTAPSVAMACMALIDAIWHTAKHGNGLHLTTVPSRVHLRHLCPQERCPALISKRTLHTYSAALSLSAVCRGLNTQHVLHMTLREMHTTP